jgi:predicted DCC family thiol-disulfide oxidoreductase YuxK
MTVMEAPATNRTPTDAPLLVYDGDCAFCARSVQFILRFDRRRTVRFAARDGVHGTAVRTRHPALASVDSLLWVDGRGAGEVVRTHSDAALAAARYLGGVWGVLAALGRVVPRPVRDTVYRVIARNRHRLGGGAAACVVFTPDERARVLD